jgi:hypothetical protein
VGCCQRTSAVTPRISPVRRSATGRYSRRSCPEATATVRLVLRAERSTSNSPIPRGSVRIAMSQCQSQSFLLKSQ